jgi:hypothetical protein
MRPDGAVADAAPVAAPDAATVAADATPTGLTCVTAGPPTIHPDPPASYVRDLQQFLADSIRDLADAIAACGRAADAHAGTVTIGFGIVDDEDAGNTASTSLVLDNATGSPAIADCLAGALRPLAVETMSFGEYHYMAAQSITCAPAATLPAVPPQPSSPAGSTRCAAGAPQFEGATPGTFLGTGGVDPVVVTEVRKAVVDSADAIAACGVGVGASRGRITLVFGLGYDNELFSFYRTSKNGTGNRALARCLRDVAGVIAARTYRVDLGEDADVDAGLYTASVVLRCAPGSP